LLACEQITLMDHQTPFSDPFPIIDRPDSDHLDLWHHSGFWDRPAEDDDEFERRLLEPTAQAFWRGQTLVAGQLNQFPVRRRLQGVARKRSPE